jgi:hypothetical protein
MRIKIAVACVLVIALSVGGYFLIPEVRRRQKEADAREKLAFVSLTDRMPKGKPIAPTKALDNDAKKRWTTLDERMATSQDMRGNVLKMLHEETRRFFVESQGAGSGRGILFTDDDILFDDYNVDPTQPGEPADFPLSRGSPLNRVEPVDEFHTHHQDGLYYFLSPWGFGYVKDRDHVSGFRSHGFRSNVWNPVGEGQRWQVKHVHLVGILSHEKPVVYLTDKLPSMDQVRQGKIRALDLFEEAGMPSLQEGEDLYLIRENDTIRMLGAIRATKTCQKCHDAEIGDLMGAFSYTLRPSEKKEKGER